VFDACKKKKKKKKKKNKVKLKKGFESIYGKSPEEAVKLVHIPIFNETYEIHCTTL
jgi:hypothetical protein